ncbi:hypothetical protein BLNAU_14847 [Blattamonas nauphoetae]|uniref:VWFA domain-containing protein n=1 Tax=Blattamonas nauphoetae TaxID=2049346 RepID=A0ABQ9XCP0_9EUKA|nr:hypothetical protein BLNAU_14847 [Blattamonas nauphoetae]
MSDPTRLQTLFAIDVSGSTGHSFYYDHVLAIFNDNWQDGDVILFWDHTHEYTTKDKAIKHFQSRNGRGGTQPSEIVSGILERKNMNTSRMRLLIITDGEINTGDIDRCDSLIKQNEVRFGFVETYVVSKYGQPNMSIAASFNRYCGSTVTLLTNEQKYDTVTPVQTVTPADMQLLDSIRDINTFEELAQVYEGLSRALTARILGTTGDRALHDEFVAMKARIAKTFSKKESSSGADMAQAIDNHDMDAAIRAGGQVVLDFTRPDGFESLTDALIRLSDGALRYTFTPDMISAARATRARTMEVASATEAVDLQDPLLTTSTFQCPITIEDETDPCIMIAKPARPLLIGVEKRQVEQLLDCPLNALYQSPFEAKLIEHIDHPLSLKMVREAEQSSPITSSPLTRRALVGFLPLGCHETHVKAADWTLAQLISGGKALGNRDFWFAVIYFLVQRGKIPFLAEMEPFMREQLIFRMRHHRTNASLTGLTTFILTPLRFDCAIFFTLCSALFTPAPEASADPLRMHIIHAPELIQMAEIAGITIPESIQTLITRTAALLQLLSMCKKTPAGFLPMLGQMLIQNGVSIDGTKIDNELKSDTIFQLPFVPLDGSASEEQQKTVIQMLPRVCHTLSVPELFWMIRMVDPSKSAVDVQIPLDWAAPALPPPKRQWGHYDGRLEFLTDVAICPATFRPYCQFSNGETWKDRFFKAVPGCQQGQRMMSVHKFTMELVGRLWRMPTLDETLCYFYGKAIRAEDKADTLMADAPVYLSTVLEQFRPLVTPDATKAFQLFTDTAPSNVRMEREAPTRP